MTTPPRKGCATLLVASALLSLASPARAEAPRVTLDEALSRSLSRYQGLATKRHEVDAAEAGATSARDAYLPDVTAAAQQSFGTINGAFGPQMPIGFSGISSSGPTAPDQSYDAAFGANYLLAVNWELFTFGRVDARIELADASARRAKADLEQEQFVHRVRVAGAYLDLLVAQQLARVAASNLERAASVESAVEARARTGLVPEVDHSTALAEVSRARLAIIDARDREQRLATQLAIFLGDTPNEATRRTIGAPSFVLDESYVTRAPSRFESDTSFADDPRLEYRAARVDEAKALAKATSRAIRPGLNLVGAYHLRASGFEPDYTPANDRYTTSYVDGVWPHRSNVIVGLTLSWNFMSPLKNRGATAAAEAAAAAARSDYELLDSQLRSQASLAAARIANMRELVREVPHQLSAAQDAYKQKKALYDSGLATLVEVQQALYALARAEADRSVAYAGLWQALLQRAASAGDFDLFYRQARTP